MKYKYFLVGSIAVVVLALDQLTKFLVEKQIGMYEVIRVIPGCFNITHVRNKGAAFGVLSGLPGVWRNVFFFTVTLAAVAVIAYLIAKTQERFLVVAFSLVAGGAAGNLIDRLRYGEVVDFIQWYVKSYFWPSFNVADSAITIGVGLLAIDMLFRNQQDAKTQAPNNK